MSWSKNARGISICVSILGGVFRLFVSLWQIIISFLFLPNSVDFDTLSDVTFLEISRMVGLISVVDSMSAGMNKGC